MRALADASRLFRRGLALVDELAAADETVRPVDAMARTLARTRPVRPLSLSRALSLGAAKYALCIALAGLIATFALQLGPIAAAFAFVVVFYVVEVQLVFLFPIALDASAPPSNWWRTARASTVRAGGTWRAFWIVLPIALRMMLGLVSTSPLRAWCAGCAAVVLWYLDLHEEKSP